MNVLIACEESQTVCSAFRELGHNAYSCDLVPCSGGHSEWHFKMDCLSVIENRGGLLENGCEYYLPEGEQWDLMIAHPPCTYLSASGARWMYHPKHSNRRELQEEAVEFFLKLTRAGVKRWCIENPVGCMSSRYRKPDQIIQPWMFGDSASKKTCLWLNNLPLLTSTNVVDAGERIYFSSGKSLPAWYASGFGKSTLERRKMRSKTFSGIAKAMAEQWGKIED